MTPSVGRIVHYVAYGTPGGEYEAGAHRAAVITEVPFMTEWIKQYLPVSLCVFNPTGLHFPRNIQYDGSDNPNPGTWHWPERVE